MGFWIFMLIMNLLLPLTMIVFGGYFRKHAPKEINELYGYRTRRSTLSRETWEFAHHHFGRTWFICGWILLSVTLLIMLLLLGGTKYNVGEFGGIICMAQCLTLVLTIYSYRKCIKKGF